MKKMLLIALVSTIGLGLQAQKKSWKEMDDFHTVMGATFHPAEENNLQPLKEKAEDLILKAKDWQQSTVPDGFNGDVTKPILKKLVKQCKIIQRSVSKNKPDAVLKNQITAAHDIFHEIMEKCRDEKH